MTAISQEFMLLANMAVAHKIYSTFPELAVLRRHPHPKVARRTEWEVKEERRAKIRRIGLDLMVE